MPSYEVVVKVIMTRTIRVIQRYKKDAVRDAVEVAKGGTAIPYTLVRDMRETEVVGVSKV